MTPKTTREHIISLHGHVTGLKKDIASIKTNHLKHMNNDIKSLGGKIDKSYLVRFMEKIQMPVFFSDFTKG